jgi:hypothetical protein
MRTGTQLLVIVSSKECALTVVATGPDFLLLEETIEQGRNTLIPVLRRDVRQVWAIAQTDLDKDVRRTAAEASAAATDRRDRKEYRRNFNRERDEHNRRRASGPDSWK